MESMSSRVDRVEGELEYLENKIPAPQNIEIEEALLEQQVMDAELEQLKKKAKLKLNNGIESESESLYPYIVSASKYRPTHNIKIDRM